MKISVLAQASLDAYSEATVDIGDSQALIKKVGNDFILAFRGTESTAADWVSDARVLPRYSKEAQAWCHRGFLEAVRDVADRIPARKYYLTGHSLGGAMATIFAAFMVEQKCYPKGLVTFGAPRAGFGGLKNKIQHIRGYRFVRDGDTVTKVPWWPYKHTHEMYSLPGATGVFSDHSMRGYAEAVDHRGILI